VGQLSVDDAFPDVVVQSLEGAIELRDRWQKGPLVVAFMRHFG
jgi:hypothetical protein